MRLKINKSKNAINYYAIIDIKTKEGKRSTKVYKRLGNEQEISKISNGVNGIIGMYKKWNLRMYKKVQE